MGEYSREEQKIINQKMKNNQLGRKMHKGPNAKAVSVRIDPKIKDALANYSSNSGRSQADIIRIAIKNYVSSMTNPKDKSFYEYKILVPRDRRKNGDGRVLLTFRLDAYAFWNFNKFCSDSGRSKTHVVENALYHFLFRSKQVTKEEREHQEKPVELL